MITVKSSYLLPYKVNTHASGLILQDNNLTISWPQSSAGSRLTPCLILSLTVSLVFELHVWWRKY